MELEVKLFDAFKRYAPDSDNGFTLSVRPGATIAQVLKILNVPDKVPRVTLVNGRRANGNTQIEEQSCLVVFSPISGG